MFRPRIIPVLLLKGKGLVKTRRFKNPYYLGDPINTVKIFNDLGADELVFLDIDATKKKVSVSSDLIKKIGDEAFMPFSVGGGITKIDKVEEILSLGAEKVVINSATFSDLRLIENIAARYGSQSIIVSVDVKKNIWGEYRIYSNSGKCKISISLYEHIKRVEEAGAGEILLTSIERDGTYEGYDIKLIRDVSSRTKIPVIACGGANSLMNLKEAFVNGGASACAAGSLFVFHGPRKGVLINYPTKNEIIDLFDGKF